MSFDDVKMVNSFVQGTDIQIIHAGSEQETLLLPPKVGRCSEYLYIQKNVVEETTYLVYSVK
jgi:hypothetical protein